jgi:hypothetical protein
VDVGGALFEGVLPQPVDDVDDVLVVGIDLLVALAQFDQLFEVVAQARSLPWLVGLLIDLARLKNCVMYCAMSSGLAITRRTTRREILPISASHSVT